MSHYDKPPDCSHICSFIYYRCCNTQANSILSHGSAPPSVMAAAISNLVELVEQRARDCPDRAAFIFLAGEELRQSSLTYRELNSRARSIAALLIRIEPRADTNCVKPDSRTIHGCDELLASGTG